jgi:hypothetical protein
MNSPKCQVLESSLRYKQKVIRALHYDSLSLVIDIQGERKFSFARVTFRKPIGFRVLDEMDLSEFWNNYSEPNGWLYEVLEGGWMELEAQRQGFSSHAIFENKLKEYLLVDDKCISVLSANPPEIEDFGTDPTDPNY